MRGSNVFYRVCFCLARFGIGIFYWLDVSGRENIPDGAALVCANHSSMLDPFFIAFAFGINCHMHIIAKLVLFKIPVLSAVLRKLGMISVDRDILDTRTIKMTLGYLKKGEKVTIFPEGTRVTEDDSVEAKNGAIRLAEHSGVPVVPTFIPRKKPLFRKIPIVIGVPYPVEKVKGRRTPEEYADLSDILMGKIKDLNPGKGSKRTKAGHKEINA